MKLTSFTLFTAILLFFTSCKKSSSGDNVTYEVKVSTGSWSGDYMDYAGGTQSLKLVNRKPNGWKYTFSVAHGIKAGLVLSAIPDNLDGSTTATANIYLNGKLVATDNNPYGATAQIIINQ
jgi:hypothetical protein